MRLLVLFDVDGTLFASDDPLAGRALREALAERFEVELPDDPIATVDHAGQTSLRIARLVLEAAGVDGAAIAAGLPGWCTRYTALYLERLAAADTSRWEAVPGAAQVLARLTKTGLRLALLTGNPEPMARARLERLGLARFFEPGQGAFGCEAESRAELIGLARARAGGWPAERTVEVGDTPRDASSALEAGIRSIVLGPAGLEGAAAELLAWAE